MRLVGLPNLVEAHMLMESPRSLPPLLLLRFSAFKAKKTMTKMIRTPTIEPMTIPAIAPPLKPSESSLDPLGLSVTVALY